jgi:1-phosphatidylinositol-4-phosphate 5-kinase
MDGDIVQGCAPPVLTTLTIHPQILKDLDLLERAWPLEFGADKGAFMEQVDRDVAFLRGQGVMDYSLLLGVVPLPLAPSFSPAAGAGGHHNHHQNIQPPPQQQQQQQQQQQHQGGRFGLGQRVLSFFLGPSPGSPQYYQQQFQRPHGGGGLAGAGGGWVVPSPRGQEVYVAGIIDILQLYNRRKQAETLLKSVVYKRDAISAVDPALYASRFLAFVDRVVQQRVPLPPPPPPAAPLPQQWTYAGAAGAPPPPPVGGLGWGRGGARAG